MAVGCWSIGPAIGVDGAEPAAAGVVGLVTEAAAGVAVKVGKGTGVSPAAGGGGMVLAGRGDEVATGAAGSVLSVTWLNGEIGELATGLAGEMGELATGLKAGRGVRVRVGRRVRMVIRVGAEGRPVSMRLQASIVATRLMSASRKNSHGG